MFWHCSFWSTNNWQGEQSPTDAATTHENVFYVATSSQIYTRSWSFFICKRARRADLGRADQCSSRGYNPSSTATQPGAERPQERQIFREAAPDSGDVGEPCQVLLEDSSEDWHWEYHHTPVIWPRWLWRRSSLGVWLTEATSLLREAGFHSWL